jgi:hypothetical protein
MTITDLEKFLLELAGGGRGRVKAITRTASTVNKTFLGRFQDCGRGKCKKYDNIKNVTYLEKVPQNSLILTIYYSFCDIYKSETGEYEITLYKTRKNNNCFSSYSSFFITNPFVGKIIIFK